MVILVEYEIIENKINKLVFGLSHLTSVTFDSTAVQSFCALYLIDQCVRE